ncbi:MAG: helix-turn-helix transcriptional regulator [Nitrososphaerota archaeon]|nr:helix-turn-helix transcriptional regulator [Nitrososphaerota archaeon]MDG6918697.1 helix-turn-helix transcriptional regulator [Nitrososphaerota archaeon]MDG6946681.1 helix-turn-helix transcriptional regulator [Nitrososphaerota archaeon]MDG6948201.1 helix-turn-helix transcriptional regulator [Nitrososphaerota archaeon]
MPDRISELHAELCKTLGSAIRIEILNALRGGEKTVGELSAALRVRQPNVSQHLAVLRQRGVVTTRKDGVNIYYGISNPKITQACELMKQVLVEQLKEGMELTRLTSPARR